MTSEEIIKVLELAEDFFGREHFIRNPLTEANKQNFLDAYYSKYGMQEEDIKQAMDQITDEQWYEQAERIR